jgi:hypothetical protein
MSDAPKAPRTPPGHHWPDLLVWAKGRRAGAALDAGYSVPLESLTDDEIESESKERQARLDELHGSSDSSDIKIEEYLVRRRITLLEEERHRRAAVTASKAAEEAKQQAERQQAKVEEERQATDFLFTEAKKGGHEDPQVSIAHIQAGVERERIAFEREKMLKEQETAQRRIEAEERSAAALKKLEGENAISVAKIQESAIEVEKIKGENAAKIEKIKRSAAIWVAVLTVLVGMLATAFGTVVGRYIDRRMPPTALTPVSSVSK